ncbi:MAG: acyltransferase [Rhodocyclaceae bacterium]|nr:acyltransferase [Rhodocyclaceae bacterium]
MINTSRRRKHIGGRAGGHRTATTSATAGSARAPTIRVAARAGARTRSCREDDAPLHPGWRNRRRVRPFTTHYAKLYSHQQPWPIDFWIGRYGVDLFFMISGYVIFLTLDKTERPADFVVSRFSRLFPAFWCAVLVTYVMARLFQLPGWTVSPREALVNMTMMPAIFGASRVDGVYWSLEKELGFYLMAGVIYYLGSRGLTLLVMASFVIAQALLEMSGLKSEVPGLWRIYAILPIEQLHLFLYGASLYFVRNDMISSSGFVLIIAICFIGSNPHLHLMHASIILILFAFLVLAITRQMSFLRHPALLFLGAISYPLYLLHNNVGSAIIFALNDAELPMAEALLAALSVSLVFAAALHRFVELPAMKKIRSW